LLDQQIKISPHILKAVKGFIEFANNPSKTEAAFDIADGLRPTGLYAQFIHHAHSHVSVAQITKERYFAPIINLDDLIEYPEESLGHHYARHMKQLGLQPDFYRKIDIEDDYSYLAMRMRQTHDIWHTITGFGTDLIGEAKLQAFTLAQMRSPLAGALLGAFLVYTLKSSIPLDPLIDGIWEGWCMGKASSPFIAQKWEEDWKKPLSEWRVDIKAA
jgi:ubiquinone biosynthesis protein COQ4